MKQLPSSRSCYVCGRENPVSLHMTFFLQDNGDVISELMGTGSLCWLPWHGARREHSSNDG